MKSHYIHKINIATNLIFSNQYLVDFPIQIFKHQIYFWQKDKYEKLNVYEYKLFVLIFLPLFILRALIGKETLNMSRKIYFAKHSVSKTYRTTFTCCLIFKLIIYKIILQEILVLSICCYCSEYKMCKMLCLLKRYFIIDQQKAQHFVQYGFFSFKPPFPTQMIRSFLNSRISVNHDKR